MSISKSGGVHRASHLDLIKKREDDIMRDKQYKLIIFTTGWVIFFIAIMFFITTKSNAISTEYTYAQTAGNSDTQTLGLRTAYDKQFNRYSLDIGQSAFYSKSNGVAVYEKYDAHIELSCLFERVIGLGSYIELMYDSSRFSGIDASYEMGAGLSWTTVRDYNAKKRGFILTTNIGGGFSYEDYTTREIRRYPYLWTDAKLEYYVISGAAFGQTLSGLFDMNDTGNIEFKNDFWIIAKISKMFRMKYSYSMTYRNEPVEGFKNTDKNYAVSVVVQF